MTEKVTPMIHVPDVRATVDWYQDVGFEVLETYGGDSNGLSFAIVRFGTTDVMFNEGGKTSAERRREVDLYVETDNVEEMHANLKGRVEFVEGLHETFYGMREFIIRDCNQFWITVGQPTSFLTLMNGVRAGNTESVQTALQSGGLTKEDLTAALDVASAGDSPNAEIQEMLKAAGAVLSPAPGDNILRSYAGKYRNEKGMEVEITLNDGKLSAVPLGQQPISLITVDEVKFRPVEVHGVTVTFIRDGGKPIGFELKQGSETTLLKRV
jgi:hypothetical protein